jgi:hypothetical protein
MTGIVGVKQVYFGGQNARTGTATWAVCSCQTNQAHSGNPVSTGMASAFRKIVN